MKLYFLISIIKLFEIATIYFNNRPIYPPSPTCTRNWTFQSNISNLHKFPNFPRDNLREIISIRISTISKYRIKVWKTRDTFLPPKGRRVTNHRKRIEEESFRADSEFKIQETGRRRWHDDLYTTYELAMVQKMPIQSSSLLRMEKFQVADELSSSLPRSGHCSPSSIFPLLPSFSPIPNHLSCLS